MKLLYVTWDGPSSTYLESLFFPIFESLRRWGVETHVLQFSWDVERFRARTQASARRRVVGWEVHEIPRRPLQLATASAIAVGAFHTVRAARRVGATVLMPRSHIPAAMALVARQFLPGTSVVWDSDGLVPDERVEFGGWARSGANYRILRGFERAMVHRAAVTMVRTSRAAQLLSERNGCALDAFHVVPNGKDPEIFTPGTEAERLATRRALGVDPHCPLLAHVGSVGPQYQLPRALAFLKLVLKRSPLARMLVLTGAREEAEQAVLQAGLPRDLVLIRWIEPDSVSSVIRACDGGFAFRDATLSMSAVSPIKICEYLLSGVPVIVNRGVGDIDVHLGDSLAGLVAEDMSDRSMEQLATHFERVVLARREEVRALARALGLKWYGLESCSAGYARALGIG